ncbi:MAG: hypothetical protein HC777_02365 [Hyphomonadaceae bacterium]|nr:hypothetical protein [Hyphomonadaceae bacterium]
MAAALMECAEKGYPKLTIAQIAKKGKSFNRNHLSRLQRPRLATGGSH